MVHQKSVICAVVSAVLVLIVAPIGQINGSPSGAPLSACTTMTPDPNAHGAAPQTNSVPFTTELPDGVNQFFLFDISLQFKSTILKIIIRIEFVRLVFRRHGQLCSFGASL